MSRYEVLQTFQERDNGAFAWWIAQANHVEHPPYLRVMRATGFNLMAAVYADFRPDARMTTEEIAHVLIYLLEKQIVCLPGSGAYSAVKDATLLPGRFASGRALARGFKFWQRCART